MTLENTRVACTDDTTLQHREPLHADWLRILARLDCSYHPGNNEHSLKTAPVKYCFEPYMPQPVKLLDLDKAEEYIYTILDSTATFLKIDFNLR